jgi:glyoxylate reductase
MKKKPTVFFTSNVFTPNEIGSNKKLSQNLKDAINDLWHELDQLAKIELYNGRFPETIEIQSAIEKSDPKILGCHLSHHISAELLQRSNLFAVCTATVGYNHIQIPNDNKVLITNTPGVLFEAVADYTIALILSNLRNVIDLHNYVWSGKWTSQEKWDMDQDLSSCLKNKVLGIVGLGEIGSEIAKKLQTFGLRIIYYDIKRKENLEKILPSLKFIPNLKDLFRIADIISLHIPLNKDTENLIDKDLLRLMKHNSLLVNTARGKILHLNDFLDLLEKKKIFVNFAFDVYPQEPIDKEILIRMKLIKKSQPEIRMTLMPHNASADADTRGRMVVSFLEDIINLIKSRDINDLKKIHIIPEQKKKIDEVNWRIIKYWQEN